MSNKLYFAKYLPVEGKIEEGDYYLDEGTVMKCILTEQDFANPTMDYYGSSQKVKLFLCSRNIKVGDILKECLSDGQPQKVHHFETVLPHGVFVFEPWPSDDEKWIRADLAFKVIGEMSPEAGWIKEGDEFGEAEVRKVILTEYYYENRKEQFQKEHRIISVTKEYILENEETILTNYIEVKGQCGHFH